MPCPYKTFAIALWGAIACVDRSEGDRVGSGHGASLLICWEPIIY
ncbi:MAG: hypothetical protein AB4352_11590 [Hormoscilla sp.]